MTTTADTDLAFAGPAALAGLVRDGEVHPRELVELYLRRIESLDPQLNAFRVVLAEQALAEADAVGRAGPLAGEQARPVFFPALGHLALEHLGGPRVEAQEFREPFGRDDHRRDLVQRGHGGRTDTSGQRGPLPHHVPLAADGEDLLSAVGVRDADLNPARVDDRHLGGVLARMTEHRPGPEELLHPGGRQRLPLGVGQRVPEAPHGGSLPAHAARGHRNIRDLTCDLACVPHRTGRVGSLVPFHGQPVPKPLALTMPGARASPRGKSAAARLVGCGTISRVALVWLVYARRR